MAGHDDAKLAAIAQAQRDGHVDPSLHPADVLALVIALSLTWSPVSVTRTATADDDDAEHDRRRDALAQAVRRAITPDA
jgi:hypothetical protein